MKRSLILPGFLALILAGWGFFSSSFVRAAEEDPDRAMMMEITSGMVCLCGCGNQILATCTCGEAQGERKYILSLVKMGKSKEEIKATMIKLKGTQVLAAPEKKGLNWILWVVVPYILPVVVMVMVGYLLAGWARKKKSAPSETSDTSSPASPEPEETDPEKEKYLEKLEKELDEFS
jgi:cytochrome c-type biogenesis protein CcmH